MEIENIRNKIESMDKNHHIEILKILKKNGVKLNENKSGVFVNLSFLSKEIIDEINTYLLYVNDQEHILTEFETQKEEFKNNFFCEN